jgi:cytochrome c551/c552
MLGISVAEAGARLARATSTLFAARSKRVRPGLDDKILTSWNALAIAGLARAARALDESGWADLAIAAADALRATVWRNGRLLATRKDERAHLNAYLDDHAFLLDALLELMQTRFRRDDFEWACEIADLLLAQFEDRTNGGFFFTSHDHERLYHRTKPGPDNATPSGNGVAASALIALGHLAAQPRYVEAGERAVRAFAAMLRESPRGCATLLMALEDTLSPPASVLLAGDAAACADWQRGLERRLRSAVRIYNVAGADLPAALVKGSTPASGAVRGCVGVRTACHRFMRWTRSNASFPADAWRCSIRSVTMPSVPTHIQGDWMKFAAAIIAAAGVFSIGAAQADAGEDLLKKSGCTACHAIDKKLVGPSYVEVAAKYKGDAGAAANLMAKIKNGGSGVWGQVPMPPNPQVSDADLKTMVAYILALKK